MYILWLFALHFAELFPRFNSQREGGAYWSLSSVGRRISPFLPSLSACALCVFEALARHTWCLYRAYCSYLLKELSLYHVATLPFLVILLPVFTWNNSIAVIVFLVSVFMIYLSFTFNLCPSLYFGYFLEGACIWIFKNSVNILLLFAFLKNILSGLKIYRPPPSHPLSFVSPNPTVLTSSTL